MSGRPVGRRVAVAAAFAVVLAGTGLAARAWVGGDDLAQVGRGPGPAGTAPVVAADPGSSTTAVPPASAAATTAPGPTAGPGTSGPGTSGPGTSGPGTSGPGAARQPASPAAPAPAPADLIAPYRGLGTWVDAFDFDPAHKADGRPTVFPADVDRMAAAGVRTLYLQTARSEDPAAPGDLIRPDLLGEFLLRAHARGMAVVAWFLPHHVDVEDDWRHLKATLAFRADGHRFDSVALDIEYRAGVADHDVRSARLVELARRLRAASGGRSLGAIVMPPVVTEVLNTNFWPRFPWAELAPLFDVWLPMSYWTNRDRSSPYRDAHTYTAENVARLRAHVGGAPVHAIGGIGDTATHADYDRFVLASREAGAIGWSNYDWDTTAGDAWPHLRG